MNLSEEVIKEIENKSWQYSTFDQAASVYKDAVKETLSDPELMTKAGWVKKEEEINGDKLKMRQQAINIFELTKGFTNEPSDNAMKSCLEMAKYVMILTNN